ncbi:MAG TPA: MIP family channel protein [Pirellulales bacterium]|jgi:aquaporin Z|nr:MIP family channel protein [Pirellulales bacterium]
MKKYLAEAIGTFILVFVGTGSVIVERVSGGQVTLVGIALTWGLLVMAMIYAVGDTSGAHLNPAVTFSFWLSRRLPARSILPYVVSQLIGALAASGLLRVMFQTSALGGTHPSGSAAQSFVLETVVTAILIFVVLCVASGSKETGMLAGVAIGGVITFEVLFAGPISGASMNPARSLAPAIVGGSLSDVWIYIFAPLLGAAVGVLGHRVSTA